MSNHPVYFLGDNFLIDGGTVYKYTFMLYMYIYDKKHTRSFDRSIVASFVSQQLLVCCYIRSIGSAAAAAAAAEADDCVCFKMVKALATGGATQHPR